MKSVFPRWIRILSWVLALIMGLGVCTYKTVRAEEDQEPQPPVEEPTFADFIERLYKVALNRDSEEEGKAFWMEKVTKEGYTGADCARFFLIDAKEFQNRNLTDEEFVETLYLTFFDRPSEEGGCDFWLDYLKDHTKTDAVNGFIDSTEWCNLCAKYGIRPGAPTAKSEIPSKNAKAFATRLYSTCLGREPDEEGLLYWALGLTNQELLACDAANEFFMSKEFRDHDFSDEEYLVRLYRTMMDREPEEEGKDFWLDYISRNTRYQILCEFVESPEFTQICKDYSIERGSLDRDADPYRPEPTPTPTPEPTPVPTETPAPTPDPGAPYDLTGMLIVIDPGHQKHANYETEPVAPWSDERKIKVSAGTTGVATERPEYEVTLEIGLMMRDYLESMGAKVIMTRTENDVNISNIERAMIAVNNKADVFLRLHCDDAGNSTARGVGVFVCSRGELADKQVGWGDMLGDAMASATGARYRGCNASEVYSGLNWATSVPSFLLEMGFMSNPEDDRQLSDPDYQKLICKGAADFCARMKKARS